MEITHIGHSCFKLKGKNLTILIDPYDPEVGYKFPKQKADVLLISHKDPGHSNIEGVSDYRLLVDSAGEYEIGGTFVNGIQTYHDKSKGEAKGKNIIYQIEMDGFTILHLGDLGHELEKETLQKISDIDVLMIPVGGKGSLDHEMASKVISSLEPAIVIPMHYATKDLVESKGLSPVKNFLEEMGVEDSFKKAEKLRITVKSEIPSDTTVYVLDMDH